MNPDRKNGSLKKIFLFVLVFFSISLFFISCRNLSKRIIWLEKTSVAMNWDDAVDYCKDLGGRLPTISELRTLIRNCRSTEYPRTILKDPWSWCGVTDSCLVRRQCWVREGDPCLGCSIDTSGRYSTLKDTGSFWSSSLREGFVDFVWYVDFNDGGISNRHKSGKLYARCVR